MARDNTLEDGDELLVGAKEIAAEGFEGKLTPRAIYHLAENDPEWGIFRIRNKLAVTRGHIRRVIRRRERGVAE
jgi:hypothetical protein